MRISDWSSDVCSSDLLERWDCISLLDRPICDADGAADSIRQPVVAPDRGVRPFQDVLIDLGVRLRSEEHTSELQSLMRISYAVFCLKKKKTSNTEQHQHVKSQQATQQVYDTQSN